MNFCESSPLVGLRTLGSSPHYWLPRLLLQWGSLLVPPQGREADERSNKVPHLYSLGANVFFSGLLSEPKGKIVTIYCITTIIWTFEGSTPNGRGAKILEINNIWLHLDFNLLEPKQPGLVTSQFATLGPFTM